MRGASRDIRTDVVPRTPPIVLQALLVSDLLCPPSELWLVSPWITDIAALDNTGGAFSALVPDWDRASIKLSQVLQQLSYAGTTVTVAHCGDGKSQPFVDALLAGLDEFWPQPDEHVRAVPGLHEKALLTPRYYLAGSLNITYQGLHRGEEAALLRTDPAEVAEACQSFRLRWGIQQ